MKGSYSRPRSPRRVTYANENLPETVVERLRKNREGGKLDLSLCNLSAVPLEYIRVYYARCLVEVDLSYNAIQYICPRFTLEMLSVTRLDLSSNQITRLPANFGNMSALIYLDVHKNLLETLPISMGELTRLQFLSISCNPFRAPLKDFLGSKGKDLSGTAIADLVVTFMKEVAAAHVHSPESSRVSMIDSNRNSKIHYRRRSSKCSRISGVSSTSSEDEEKVEQVLLEKSPSWFERWCGWAKPFFITTFIILTIPFLLAYFMDTAYLDEFFEGAPQSLNSFWNTYYKTVHETASFITDYLPKLNMLYLRGTPKSSIVNEPTMFARILNVFRIS